MSKKRRFILLTAAIMLLIVSGANAEIVVVDFDDLDYDVTLSGTTYAGLTWEWGNEGPSGNAGEWCIPSGLIPVYPYSEPYCAVNGWGSTLMGIGFPETVDVLGAYFAGRGDSLTTSGVRIHGYLGETDVATTDWFNDMDTTPSWFAINLNNIDRIVVEAVPVSQGGGFYYMDNLTYTPEPATISLLALGGLALLRNRKFL